MLRAGALWVAAACCFVASAQAATCPPPGFTTVSDFNLTSYISRPWFSLQQAVTSYQPLNSFFCVRAEYRRSPGDASRLLVFNQGRTGSVTGPQQGGGAQFLLNAVVRDESRGKLAVGPSFLPASAYGPYWVVAAGPSPADYEWAIISGGPPTEQGASGTCTNTRSGSFGVGGGEGLWLFSRDPTPPDAQLVTQLRGIAADKGFDLSVLKPVQQAGCSYLPFPSNPNPQTNPFAAFSG